MRLEIPDRLPEDADAERGFLSTVCAPGATLASVEAVAMLAEEDFCHPSHRAVFHALVDLQKDGIEVNSLTLKDKLDEHGLLPKVGGFAGLVEILAGEDVLRPQVLASVILRKSKLRKLTHVGARLARAAAIEEEAPEALLDAAVADLARLSLPAQGKGLKYIGEVGDLAYDAICASAEGRRSHGVSTGLPSLDRKLSGGLKPGQVMVLAARPSVGKTTIALEWTKRCAQHHGTAAFFSLEMSSEEVWARLATNGSGIGSDALGTGTLSADDWRRLQAIKAELATLPFMIDDQAEITVPEIRARIDRASSRSGPIGLVVVDYLQLLSTARGSAALKQNESIRLGEISRGLKLLAKDRNVPVVVLSQLNREVEKRQGGRPQLSDLRDSGAIEQDADVVVFLHRQGTDTTGQYEAIVAKNRNGALGSIPLVADLATYSFREGERVIEMPQSAPKYRL